ncbi:hypothetical protein [Deinococcus marmoris]|uniref:Uncharacterized protein n=1 Tax=Deinococcus marmoris TaxID=249408 RepID=A0A1U7P580_9DEIO|nr:hypothetical protein [Deinococcus marmoris]OLV20327.1 hypothetical protein BOO71_0000037 [Deinococcus marmoris]
MVKAFNTVPAADLESQGDVDKPLDERRAIPIASDTAKAKTVVSRLIEDISFVAADNGDLEQSKTQWPGTPIYGKEATTQQAREVLEI